MTLLTPRGEAITKDLDLSVSINGKISKEDMSKIEALMVTGRNATGKSALVRRPPTGACWQWHKVSSWLLQD